MTTAIEEARQATILDRFVPVKPDIDYLAKDYNSFRQLMIDHLSVLVPNWREESPADLGNVLVDLLAYAADYASYYQDAVASEAYLGTARLRYSVKRHARLLDYALHEGSNARVWAHVCVKRDLHLAQGTRLFTQVAGLAAQLDMSNEMNWLDTVTTQSQTFETLYDCQLYAAHNEMRFVSSGDGWLRQGTTSANIFDGLLNDKGELGLAAGSLKLAIGDLLVFEELRDPVSGDANRANPQNRHAVRLTKVSRQSNEADQPYLAIEWSIADALPFEIFIASEGQKNANPYSVARGNIVLADHGRWVKGEALPAVPSHGVYRPALLVPGLTHRAPFEPRLAHSLAATETLQQDSKWTLPVLTVKQIIKLPKESSNALLALRFGDGIASQERGHVTGYLPWRLQRDLLNSGPFSRDYMVEMEEDRRAYLRFGFDGLGKPPLTGERFLVDYRVGNGATGNIGADTLAHIAVPHELIGRISSVRNPLPARGGSEPERLDEARLYAPQAFQVNTERCVTEADYARRAEQFPDVERAAARIRWIELWQTVLIFVQRKGNRKLEPNFCNELVAYIEKYRYMGHDVEIRPPQFVPLDIQLKISLKMGAQPRPLRQALYERFVSTPANAESLAYFDPANFTFGQSVYQSQIVAEAMKVAGVAGVEVKRFCRLGSSEVLPEIKLEPLEIAQVRNDRKAPQEGTIEFSIDREDVVTKGY